MKLCGYHGVKDIPDRIEQLREGNALDSASHQLNGGRTERGTRELDAFLADVQEAGWMSILHRLRDGHNEGLRALTPQVINHYVDTASELRGQRLLSTIYNYTLSFVMEEQAVFPRPGERSPQYDIAERKAKLDPEEFPILRQSGPILFDGF